MPQKKIELLRKICAFFVSIFLSTVLYSQTNIDSLINLSKSLPDDSAKIIILHKISWKIKSEQPTVAIEYGNQALDLARVKKYPKLEAKSLKIIATAYLLAGNYQKAENYYITAIKMFDKIGCLKDKSSCYNNLGLTLQYKGDNIGASEAYKESIAIDKTTNNKKGEAASLSNLGNVLQNSGNYVEAINKYMQSLKIRYEINDLRGIANIYNNIGAIYEKQKNYEEALKNYEEALSGYVEIDDKREICLAMNNIGYILYLQKKYEKALHYFEQTIEKRKEFDDKKGLSVSCLNMANLYLDIKQYDNAFKYLNMSEKYSLFIGNKYQISQVVLTKSRYYLEQKKYSEVIKLLSNIDYKNSVRPTSQTKLFDMLSKAFFAVSSYKQAFLIQQKYIALSDSITREANAKKIIQIQTEYEFEKKQNDFKLKKQKQKLLHEKEIMRERFIQGIVVIILIAVVFISIFIYRSYLFKTRDNKSLQFHKNQTEIINKELLKYQDKLLSEKQITEMQYGFITEFSNYSKLIKKLAKNSEYPIENMFKSHFIIDTNSSSVCITKRKGDWSFILFGNIDDGTKAGRNFMTTLMSLILDLKLGSENISSVNIMEDINAEIYNIIQDNKSKKHRDKLLNAGLCVINNKLNTLNFFGANSSLLVLKNEEIKELERNKFSLFVPSFDNLEIINSECELNNDDQILLFANSSIDNNTNVDNYDLILSNVKYFLLKNSNSDVINIKSKIENWHNNNMPDEDIFVLGFSGLNAIKV